MRAVLFLILFSLAACGHYQGMSAYKGGTGEYHGMGSYRTADDYTAGAADDEDPEAHEYLNGRQQYVPRGIFVVFWPVEQVKINRGFHPKSDPHHAGIDLGGRKGTPILAAHEGLVVYAGRDFRGYGNMVLLEFNKEWATLYAHLDDIAVKEGMILTGGDQIGTMGATGRATGVHLHFELIRNRKPVDPLPLLGKNHRFANN